MTIKRNIPGHRDRKIVFAIVGALAALVVFAVAFALKSHRGSSEFSATIVKPLYFQSHHQLSGTGESRPSMDDTTLSLRTDKIIAAQTFNIMRNSDGEHDDAAVWAQRVTAPALHSIIVEAARSSEFPASLLESIILDESGGDAKAHSPTGPRGIMQMTASIGRFLHLYHKEVKTEKVKIRIRSRKNPTASKGHHDIKGIVKTVKRVITVDDREDPVRSIPAGAKLLEDMSRYYRQQYQLSVEASRQFAVWEWHSGRTVVNKALMLAKEGGIRDITLPKVFFLNSPGYNAKLFTLIQDDLKHDYGPTYWFRIVRAGQLLDLYRANPDEYTRLMNECKSTVPGVKKAASRLEVWYSLDGSYQNLDDLKRAASSGELVQPPDDPAYFSFALHMEGSDGIGAQDPKHRELYALDPPEVIGALLYVASETRRGWEQSHPAGERFIPLKVTSMVRTTEYQKLLGKVNENALTRFPSHTIGAVDVSFAKLPRGEDAWLHFVLQDLGFEEYIGYFDEKKAQKTMHFAPSPKQGDFFRTVYDEAVASTK